MTMADAHGLCHRRPAQRAQGIDNAGVQQRLHARLADGVPIGAEARHDRHHSQTYWAFQGTMDLLGDDYDLGGLRLQWQNGSRRNKRWRHHDYLSR